MAKYSTIWNINQLTKQVRLSASREKKWSMGHQAKNKPNKHSVSVAVVSSGEQHGDESLLLPADFVQATAGIPRHCETPARFHLGVNVTAASHRHQG